MFDSPSQQEFWTSVFRAINNILNCNLIHLPMKTLLSILPDNFPKERKYTFKNVLVATWQFLTQTWKQLYLLGTDGSIWWYGTWYWWILYCFYSGHISTIVMFNLLLIVIFPVPMDPVTHPEPASGEGGLKSNKQTNKQASTYINLQYIRSKVKIKSALKNS